MGSDVRDKLGIGLVRPVPAPFVYRYTIHPNQYDGDSPKVILDYGRNIKQEQVAVRLFGVDTPEVRGITREEGKRVRDIVRGWMDETPEGVLESHRKGSGKYGRLLATLWPDGWGMSLNERLFREGLAVIKTYNAAQDALLARLWGDAP